MSDDRYRRRRDPYIGPLHDHAPDSSRNGDFHSRPDPDASQNEYHHSENRSSYRDEHNDTQRSGKEQYTTDRNYRRPSQQERQVPRDQDAYRERNAGDEYSYRDSQQRSVTYPVRFHGKTSEYFRIWIVNVFLTIVTLYIYSAWAKVRTKRYFYGNTTIDNSSFEYHAIGSQLVVGRLIAAVLLITYTFFQGIDATISAIALGLLIVMFPWAVWRSLRFNARASSYRNIRFGFEGKASPPYLNIVIIPLVVLGLLGLTAYAIANQFGAAHLEQLSSLSETTAGVIGAGVFTALILLLALLIPLLHKNLISYSLNNHRYGTAGFSAQISTGRIYGIHLLTILFTLFSLAIIGAVVFGLFQLFLRSSALFDSSDLLTRLEPYADILSGVLVYTIAIPITGLAVAFFRSRIRNHRYNATTIGSSVQLKSTTTVWSLWWLNLSNLALLIFSLGLAYPFTKIRSARYFADRTSVIVAGKLDSFTEREKTRLQAMGEEMADAFDVEFDIGI